MRWRKQHEERHEMEEQNAEKKEQADKELAKRVQRLEGMMRALRLDEPNRGRLSA